MDILDVIFIEKLILVAAALEKLPCQVDFLDISQIGYYSIFNFHTSSLQIIISSILQRALFKRGFMIL